MKKWICLLVIGLTIFISACEEEVAEEENLGEEVSLSKLETTLKNALAGSDPLTMSVGEYVRFELNQKVETGAPITLSYTEEKVEEKIDDVTRWIYKVMVEETVFNDGDVKTNKQPTYEAYAKASSAAVVESILQPSHMIQTMSSTLAKVGALEKERPRKITHHNLSVLKTSRALPKAVRENRACLGIANCMVSGTELKFDRVYWYAESKEKYKFTYFISTQVPYRAQIMEGCLAFLYKTNGKTYYVNQCNLARDFVAGSNTAPL